MKCRPKPIDTECFEYTGDLQAAQDFVGERQVDPTYSMPGIVDAREFLQDVEESQAALWVSGITRWSLVRVGDFIITNGDDGFWPVGREKFYNTYDILDEPIKVEVHINGVVTAKDIEDSVGRMVQRSARFR